MEDFKNRTSRGLIEELQTLIYEMMAIGDHLMDLRGEELIEALEHIEKINYIRQLILASYAKEDIIDYKYHCPYKHCIKVAGVYKEALIAAQRNNQNDIKDSLLNSLDIFMETFNWVTSKYFKLQVDDPKDCSKCLDDLLLKK